MCQGAAQTGLFQEGGQLGMQGDSTACDGLNPGVVQHKQSGTELLIEGTKKSTEPSA